MVFITYRQPHQLLHLLRGAKMKKGIALLLTFAMAVSLAACSGGGNSTAAAASAQSTAGTSTEASKAASKPAEGAGNITAEWNVSEEKTLEYENGQVLIDTEDVRISASALKNRNTDKGMALRGMIKVENLTDGPIMVNGYKNKNKQKSWSGIVGPGETKELGGTASIYDWNGKIGNSEECYQGRYMIRVTDNTRLLAAAVFDWYASDSEPLENIITDEVKIASEWGEVNENYAKGNGKSADNTQTDRKSADNTQTDGRETSADTGSETVRVLFGIGGSETDRAAMENVRNTVAADGIDLELRPLPPGGSPIIDVTNGQVDTCFGESNACLSETKNYLMMTGNSVYAGMYDIIAEEACPVGYTRFTPLYICSEKFDSADELKNGATIAVPWEFCTGGFMTIRAARLLEAAGLVTLKDTSEMPDYTAYYLDSYFKETAPGINIEFAAPLGYQEIRNDPSAYDAVLMPEKDYGKEIFGDPNWNNPDYWEQLWVRKKDVKDPAKLDAFEKIIEAYQSQATTLLVENTVGWDIDLISQYR